LSRPPAAAAAASWLLWLKAHCECCLFAHQTCWAQVL
jgi:hypothetical protein